jgi:hypothetical protein
MYHGSKRFRGDSPLRLGDILTVQGVIPLSVWGLILLGARRAEIALLPSKSILFLYVQRLPLRFAGGIPFVQHTTPLGSHLWAIPGRVCIQKPRNGRLFPYLQVPLGTEVP